MKTCKNHPDREATDGNYCHPCKLARKRELWHAGENTKAQKHCERCQNPREKGTVKYCKACSADTERERKREHDRARKKERHAINTCNEPHCAEIIPAKDRYCEKHRAERRKKTNHDKQKNRREKLRLLGPAQKPGPKPAPKQQAEPMPAQTQKAAPKPTAPAKVRIVKKVSPLEAAMLRRIDLIAKVDELRTQGCHGEAEALRNSFSRKDCPYRVEQVPVKIRRKEKQA